MYKFRTMYSGAEQEQAALLELNERDGPAFKIRNDPRVTPLGRLLRRTCADELPQLWNVLKGHMSLVGPRPLPCHETAALARWQRRRLDVTPGLTCTWQVAGGLHVSFDQWMRMDIRYAQTRNFWGDVKLLFQTLWRVVSCALPVKPRGKQSEMSAAADQLVATTAPLDWRRPWLALLLLWGILFVATEVNLRFTTADTFNVIDDQISDEARASSNADAAEQGSMARRVGLVALAAFGAVCLVIPAPRRVRVQGLTGALALVFLGWALVSVVWSHEPLITLRKQAVLGSLAIGALGVARCFSLRTIVRFTLFAAGGLFLLGVASELALGTFPTLEPRLSLFRARLAGLFGLVGLATDPGRGDNLSRPRQTPRLAVVASRSGASWRAAGSDARPSRGVSGGLGCLLDAQMARPPHACGRFGPRGCYGNLPADAGADCRQR